RVRTSPRNEAAPQPRKPGGNTHVKVLTALLVPFATTVMTASAEPNDGTVAGQVVNKTAGGGSPAGATVTLVSFGRKEQAPLGQRTAQTDAGGRYSFADLDRDPNIVYLTLARF